jgi:outer membrane immunogenic protein
MRTIIAAALLAASSATPAFAQVSTARFEGGHVEAITGYDHVTDGDDGILYGIGGGYDFRNGNFVFGIEGEVLESTAGECGGGICVNASRDFYVGGRIGAVVGDNVLIYGKLGYSNARIEATSGNTTVHDTVDGIRGGVGVEVALGNSPLTLRTEYRYTNYEQGGERHQGTLGLAFRF